MTFAINMIAAGHDNEDNLTRWSKLGTINCPLFQGYKKYIPTEWHCSESQALGGDRKYVKIGSPWFALRFPYLTEEEYYKLITDFTDDGLSGFVTVTAYDRDALTWKTFNATMWVLPDNIPFDVEKGFYAGTVEFRDLEEVA